MSYLGLDVLSTIQCMSASWDIRYWEVSLYKNEGQYKVLGNNYHLLPFIRLFFWFLNFSPDLIVNFSILVGHRSCSYKVQNFWITAACRLNCSLLAVFQNNLLFFNVKITYCLSKLLVVCQNYLLFIKITLLFVKATSFLSE